MKKLKHLKKINNILDEMMLELKKESEKLKKEYQRQLIVSNTELLNRIAEGENLDIVHLLDKYMDGKTLKKSDEKSNELIEESNELLSHMMHKGKDYFFEDIENGKVYDDKSNHVGVFNLGKIKFNN
tara:strand:- start:423 stop:803 length:381 start_codon:yes stop_codon:yes gene_type:complete